MAVSRRTRPRVAEGKAERISDELARLSPKWRGVSYARLEAHGFLQWPCVDADDPGTEIVHRDGKFLRGRAKLTSTPWQEPGELPDTAALVAGANGAHVSEHRASGHTNGPLATAPGAGHRLMPGCSP